MLELSHRYSEPFHAYRIFACSAASPRPWPCAPSRRQAGQPPTAAPPIEVDADTQKVLDEINSLNAYQRPKLPLKNEDRYAHTAKDVTPLRPRRAVQAALPAQMEYTGPGRAIPEPEDVKTVKIGFIGPIEPTVSVATGGKSHEETLGKQMLRAASWRSRRPTPGAAT